MNRNTLDTGNIDQATRRRVIALELAISRAADDERKGRFLGDHDAGSIVEMAYVFAGFISGSEETTVERYPVEVKS